MALTQRTKKYLQIKMDTLPNTNYQLGVPEGQSWDGFNNVSYTYTSTGSGVILYKPVVRYSYYIERNGVRVTSDTKSVTLSSSYASSSQATSAAQTYGLSYVPSPSSCGPSSGSRYNMQADGLYGYGTVSTYDVQYYHVSVIVKSAPVGGVQVGNVAIYKSGELISGSDSKTKDTNAATVSAEFDTEDTSVSHLPKIVVVATASAGTTSTSRTEWHNSYALTGVSNGGTSISNLGLSFDQDKITTNDITLNNDSTTIVVSYGAKKSITLSGRSGVQSYSASYSPSYERANYSNSASSISGSTGTATLHYESGRPVALSATAASGYVFASDGSGFISQTDGVDDITGNGSSTLSYPAALFAKDAVFNVVPTSYSIKVSIPDESKSGWGTCHINSAGTTETQLYAGQTYTFGFTSSRPNQEAPSVDYWAVNGTQIEGNSYTAPSTLSGNVSVSCFLKQNARQVSVSKTSNGDVSVRRYAKSSGAEISDVGWLLDDGSDYVKVTPTPDSHYDATVTTSGLDAYSEGGDGAFSLTSGASAATVDVAFTLAECVIRTAVPTGFGDICEVSPQTQTLRWDAGDTAFRNVYCNLKAAHYDAYRVASWDIGGVTRTDGEVQSAGRSWYFTVSPSDVNGKAELVCTPKLVSTMNAFAISVSGRADLLQLSVTVGTDAVEYLDVGETSWTKSVREAKTIKIGITKAFGGKVSSVTATCVTITSQSESEIQLTMPSNACSVAITASEIEKTSTSVQLATEEAHAEVVVGSITIRANGSEVAVVKDTHAVQSFQFYKGLPYTLTASDSDETYCFAGWYRNGTIVSTNLSHTVTAETHETYVAKYVMRTTGTISIEYGLKSGDDVTSTTLPVGAAFGVEITTPKDSESGWVVGANRTISFRVSGGNSVENGVYYNWVPVRVDTMLADGSDTWTTSWTYDDNNPGAVTGSFAMRSSMKVRMVYAKEQRASFALAEALFLPGSDRTMGGLSVYSVGMIGYSSPNGNAQAGCLVTRKVVLRASVMPGHSFTGWWTAKSSGGYESVSSHGTELVVDSLPSSGCRYYASFAASRSKVLAWGDGDAAKTFTWQSKVYVGAQYNVLRNVRVYSDAYPVKLTVFTSSSPDACTSGTARSVVVTVRGQYPHTLPAIRLDKYFCVRVDGSSRVNCVMVGSSMEALRR